MLKSFSEYKFFQSFRIPVEQADNVRFLVEEEHRTEDGKIEFRDISDAKLLDISLGGLGFSTKGRLPVGDVLRLSLQYKKIYLDLTGKIVRAFNDGIHESVICYGVELDEDDSSRVRRFLEQFIHSLNPDRIRQALLDLSLAQGYSKEGEGFEMISLILSLVKDISRFGKQENFCENMLSEICRILDAKRATLYLINPTTDRLEASASVGGADKNLLKFDYRKGIAGSVFTTGLSLNMKITPENARFSQEIDQATNLRTECIACEPITNREDKVVGTLEVVNKIKGDHFTLEDEKVMKVLGLIFSSVFHGYSPISEESKIRRFSTPFNRKFAIIGKSPLTTQIRQSIVKMKDLDIPLLVEGEVGTGKTLLAKIVHHEGKRGLRPLEVVNCGGRDEKSLELELFGQDGTGGVLQNCHEGSVILQEVSFLSPYLQERLLKFLGLNLASEKHSNVRLICTSSKDLHELAEEQGVFNKELLERLSLSVIHIPALRKRGEQDIKDLADYFLKSECNRQGLLIKEFSPEVMVQLAAHDWPANVRELKESVAKAVLYNPKVHIISHIDDSVIPIINNQRGNLKGLSEIPFVTDYSIPLKDRLALVERQMILAEIKRNNGNKSKTAKLMGISREALRKKLLQSDSLLEKLKEVPLVEPSEKIAA